MLALLLIACAIAPPDVDLAPRPASSSEDLVVSPDPPVGETWTYRWSRDGVVQSDLLGNRVPAGRTARGQEWQVAVERHVGQRSSEAALASVVVGNGAPEVQATVVETDEGLRAAVWASDPDADELTVGWSWAIGDEVLQEGGIFAGDVARGDTILLQAWADDGEQVAEIEVAWSVGNQAPSILDARIEPDAPGTSEPLTVEVDAVDPDGDDLQLDVTWRADGAPFAIGVVLPAAQVPHGPLVDAVVVADDGLRSSPPFTTAPVVVEKRPPSISAARVEPSVLAFGVGPGCVVDGWSDPDGDPELLAVRWYIDGVLYSGTADPSGTEMEKGRQVQCEATPVDADGAGEPILSDAVLVVNTPPSLSQVILEPEEPAVGEPITAVLETLYDPDDDPLTVRLEWSVNGSLLYTTFIGDGSVDGEVFPGLLERGDELVVEARPFDGDDVGLVVSDTIEIANALPVVDSVAIDPDPPVAGQDLTALVEASDGDGDPLTIYVAWEINGGAPIVSHTLDGTLVVSGDTLTVKARADDGFDTSPSLVVGGIVVP